MTRLNSNNFFFFDCECSELEIFPNTVEHAYLAILNDELESAKRVFEFIDSPRASWGMALISILEGFVQKFPTYFQIRNFLEIDMDFLLRNNKITYVELLLGSLEFLSNINQETYKFAARVMLVNKLYSAALKYMEKSKRLFYNDPELHFMYAKYYFDFKNYEEAYFYINECLKMLSDYYPAVVMKQKIEQIIN